MQIVDANIVLRYILGDHEELSAKAKKIVDENIAEVPIEVLSEVVYILCGFYHIDRQEISAALTNFLQNTQSVLSRRDVVFKGLELYAETKLDFVDCILAGYHAAENAQIFTFDKPLNTLLNQISDSTR